MRVLVLATGTEWTAGVRLLATLSAALSERGEVVAVACARQSAVATAIGNAWPRLSVRAVVGRRRVGQFTQLRTLVSAMRPDAILVGSVADAKLAALAVGRGGGVVRRVAIGEQAQPVRATQLFAGARIDQWGTGALAIGWPAPVEADEALHTPPRTTIAPPELVILMGARHDEAVAVALRAAAQLRSRHPTLRVTLAGDRDVPQDTRVHAAALRLTPALEIINREAVLTYARPAASAMWCVAPGDAGACGVLAAMQQHVPVVVAHDAPYASLVAPAITGFLWQAESTSTTIAELARLFGDVGVRRMIGEAAANRALRDFSWNAFVNEATERLRAVAIKSARRTPSAMLAGT